MSEGPTPSDPLTGLVAARSRWSGPVTPDSSPWVVGYELTTATDEAIAALDPDKSVTVVAVGGYGAGRLSLHSDIDLLLLHDGGSTGPAAARSLVYPLWDAGLRVGHGFRTVRECLTLARDDLTALCSVLTARLVAGPSHRFERLEYGLARLLRNERSGLAEVLAADENEVWTREPFALQEPNLKESRGGLRSLDRIRWMRRRDELVLGASEVTTPDEEAAERVLLGTRTALHAVRGRPHELYAIDLRVTVGRWLQTDPLDVAGVVYGAMGAVDILAGARWSGVRHLGSDPLSATGRRVVRFVRQRWGRAAPPSGMMGMALEAAGEGSGHLDSHRLSLVREAPAPDWDEGDRRALLELLAGGRPAWEAFLGLWAGGWVDRALPELAHLRGLPQSAPFHLHPVDAHLGATVAEVLALADGAEDWCETIADELGGLDEVLLAALLHDAGKGLGGDHSIRGAELTRELLGRMGFDTDVASLVSEVVRHHLLLTEVAFRRDIDDPTVIGEVAEVVGDPHLLRVLTLLTVADSRATGPESWSRWRSSLMRRLFSKVDDALGPGTPDIERRRMERLRSLLGAELGERAIDRHLAALPEGHLLRFGSTAVAAHIRLAAAPPQNGRIASIVDRGDPVSTLFTAAADRPGLLASITGVLALDGIEVIEARVATRRDGLALDSFRVVDPGGDETRWDEIRRRLALASETVLAEPIARRRRSHFSSATNTTEPEVVTRRRGPHVTVEVRTADRIGLLHDLAVALSELGLDVDLAKIDTRGDRVVDTFWVRDPEDGPERDAEIRSVLISAAGQQVE